jgi:hypothetical protein
VSSVRWRRICPAAFVAAALLAPATAHASSLVFTRPDGNVWLANADGTGLYQVTLDGNPGDPYEAPSQADDGTIATTRGSGSNELLYRLAQNGTVLSAFRPAVEFSLGLFDAQVSPDGSKVAYWTGYVGNSTCEEVPPGTIGAQFCYSTAITSSTSPTDLGGGLSFRTNATWMSNTRLVTGGRNFYLSTYDLGAPADVTWVATGDPHEPELSDDGARLVSTAGLSQERIQLYATSGVPQTDGPPPAAPTPACFLSGATGGQFDDPTWAPGGGALAWAEGDGDSTTPPAAGEGIWIWNLGNTGNLAADCNSPLPGAVAIPGAENPDFGPANVNPGPRTPSSSQRPLPPPPPRPQPDQIPPAFQGSITLNPAAFAAANRGASIAQRRAPVGTTVRYRLSETATVTFTVEREQSGRRVGGRCVKPARSNRRRPRCKRHVLVSGSFTHGGQAGRNAFQFTGRISGRKLSRGRYRLTGIARDATGNVSAPKRAQFRIVRR